MVDGYVILRTQMDSNRHGIYGDRTDVSQNAEGDIARSDFRSFDDAKSIMSKVSHVDESCRAKSSNLSTYGVLPVRPGKIAPPSGRVTEPGGTSIGQGRFVVWR
jgi:hypothetical protein